MIRLGTQLAVFSFVSNLVVQFVMLIKFLSRSERAGPSVGELFHTLLCGLMLKPYRTLLISEGIEPTLMDELLYRVSIILAISFFCGIVTIGLGFALNG